MPCLCVYLKREKFNKFNINPEKREGYKIAKKGFQPVGVLGEFNQLKTFVDLSNFFKFLIPHFPSFFDIQELELQKRLAIFLSG